jgi:hypothetical protein
VKQIISKIGLRDPHRSPILHGIGQFPNLGADNARSENVWRWFMRNPEITKAMELIGLRQSRPSAIADDQAAHSNKYYRDSRWQTLNCTLLRSADGQAVPVSYYNL